MALAEQQQQQPFRPSMQGDDHSAAHAPPSSLVPTVISPGVRFGFPKSRKSSCALCHRRKIRVRLYLFHLLAPECDLRSR